MSIRPFPDQTASSNRTRSHAGGVVAFSQKKALSGITANDLSFAAWEDFLASGMDANCFFLDVASADLQDAVLWQIRSSDWWDAWIALDVKAPESPYESLADARQSRKDAQRSATQMQSVRAGMPERSHLDFEERLLQFLFMRDGAHLVPVCDRNSHYLYRFPLAESLGADEERVTRVLLDLQRRRYLQPGLLIDRVRHCRKCSSAHPHYYDVCPNCRSIQIEKSAALHCFTCGNVAPQADFMQDAKLVCPQCNASLRHIGVDYDRPLTQYACADCRQAFVEPDVQVRCLDCGDVAAPAELDLRTVASLRLSARGRAALREGSSAEHLAAAEHPQHVSATAFSQALGWTLRPDGDVGAASLMVLEFGDTQQDGAAQTLADEAVRRLHELLSDTDLSTVDSDQRLWLLMGDGAGLLDRVRAMYPAGGQGRIRSAALALRDVGQARAPQQVMSLLRSELS